MRFFLYLFRGFEFEYKDLREGTETGKNCCSSAHIHLNIRISERGRKHVMISQKVRHGFI